MEQEQTLNFLDLLPDEIRGLIQKLKEALDIVENCKATISKVVHKEIVKKDCPYCGCSLIVKNGHTKNKVQTYKCKICQKRFNDLTGTLFENTKLSISQIEKLIQCMTNKNTIEETAEILGVNTKTAFLYRHKILNILSNFNDEKVLHGEVEADEHYMSINLKGTKTENMPRASKHRKSHGGSKRGISDHQVCIASAIDENDNIYFKIEGTGPITSDGVYDAFKNKIEPSSILITDCKSSYEKFAQDNSIHLEQVKSGTYKNLNGYSLGNINEIHSELEGFLEKFRGVSTKHLKGYLCWFSFMKLLRYTVSLLNRRTKFSQEVITKKTEININNLYDNTSGIDFFEVYKDYNYHA